MTNTHSRFEINSPTTSATTSERSSNMRFMAVVTALVLCTLFVMHPFHQPSYENIVSAAASSDTKGKANKNVPVEVVPYEESTEPATTTTTALTTTATTTTAVETAVLQKKDKTAPAEVSTYVQPTTTTTVETTVLQKKDKTAPAEVSTYVQPTTTTAVETTVLQKKDKTAPAEVSTYVQSTTTTTVETTVLQKKDKTAPAEVSTYVQPTTTTTVETTVLQKKDKTAPAEVSTYVQPTTTTVVETTVLQKKDKTAPAEVSTYVQTTTTTAVETTVQQKNKKDNPVTVPDYDQGSIQPGYDQGDQGSIQQNYDQGSVANVEATIELNGSDLKVTIPQEFDWDSFFADFNKSEVGFAVGTDRDFIYGFNNDTYLPTNCIGKPAFISRFLWNLENRTDINTGEKHSLDEIVELNEVAAQHLRHSTVMNTERGYHVGMTVELKQACYYSISFSDNTGYEIAAFYNNLWFGEDDKQFLSTYFGRVYGDKGRYGMQTASKMLQEAQYVVNFLKAGSPYALMLKDWMGDWAYYDAHIAYYAENFGDYAYVGRKIGWWDGQQTEMVILQDKNGNWFIVVAMTLQNGDEILIKIGEAIIKHQEFIEDNSEEDENPNPEANDPMDLFYGNGSVESDNAEISSNVEISQA